MSGLPYSKFFGTDWLADQGLRMCRRRARGLWIDLLCFMQRGEGYLVVNGQAPTVEQIASMTGGATVEETAEDLAELEAAGVYSRDNRGVILSRRMVRDIAKFERDKSNGKRGGNPHLKDNGGGNGPKKPPKRQDLKGVNRGVNGDVNLDSRERARDQSPESIHQERKIINNVEPLTPRMREDGIIENYWMDGRSVLKGTADADTLLQRTLEDEQDVRRAQCRIDCVAKSRKSRRGYIDTLRADLGGGTGPPMPAISVSDAVRQSLMFKRMAVRQ